MFRDDNRKDETPLIIVCDDKEIIYATRISSFSRASLLSTLRYEQQTFSAIMYPSSHKSFVDVRGSDTPYVFNFQGTRGFSNCIIAHPWWNSYTIIGIKQTKNRLRSWQDRTNPNNPLWTGTSLPAHKSLSKENR